MAKSTKKDSTKKSKPTKKISKAPKTSKKQGIHKSFVNLSSTLAPGELIAVMNANDKPTGEVVVRKEMRRRGLWHRATSILVKNDEGKFCFNKRSLAKDYCPGFLDSSFGGIVASDEIDNIDLAAKREAEEEMGLPDLKKIKLNGKAIVPQFRFKLKFNDGRTKCFLYIYDMPWSKQLEKKGYKIKP